jgi:hypothetical protein
MSKACGTTGRVIYTERKVADRAALKGWVRGGRKLALTVHPCGHSTGRPHYHLVPVNEELIRENLNVMEEGALARVVNPTNDLSDMRITGIRRYMPGFEFVVEDYVPADVAKDGVAFYWGSAEGGGNNVCVAAADVEQVKSAEEMGMRMLPEAKELLDFICSAMLGEGEGLTIEGMHADGREIAGFGTTDDGLDFAFEIPLAEIKIWRTDG